MLGVGGFNRGLVVGGGARQVQGRRFPNINGGDGGVCVCVCGE